MILALAFKALHAWGALRFGFWMGVVPIYAFLRHSGKVPDFHSENPTTCHLTFAAEIRHYFTLGDMDCDNHTGRGEAGIYIHTSCTMQVLGYVPLNPIVWCYVWHCVWHFVVINKVVLLLSKIMVIWTFGHYHIVHEMHSMWFMWFSHRRYKSQVLCKFRILVRSRCWNWAFHLRKL